MLGSLQVPTAGMYKIKVRVNSECGGGRGWEGGCEDPCSVVSQYWHEGAEGGNSHREVTRRKAKRSQSGN